MVDKDTKSLLEISEQAIDSVVQRQVENASRQPRFDSDFQYRSFFRLVDQILEEEPPYCSDTRVRDEWLDRFWHKESLISGAISSIVQIDANRGWTLTGGRNQVLRFNRMMADAENGMGWRYYAKRASVAFWTSDLGSITEAGREGENGPMRAIYNVDSTRCRMTGIIETPLQYNPVIGSTQYWKPQDFFRVVSMPSQREDMLGVGYCALSRALEIVKVLYAIWQYDLEKLNARAPRGIMLLNGIDESQWIAAMEARNERQKGLRRDFYGGVEVLCTFGENAEAKLISLSQLPDGFDQKTMVDLSMYGISLAFGVDPREFWPVSGGTLGTGRETEVQAEKATSKGGGDFRLSYQERLQKELPDTIHFEFSERDDQGELLAAQVNQAKADWIATLSSMRESVGAVFTSEQIVQLSVEHGLVPDDWTAIEEDVTATDEQGLDRMLENSIVRHACERFPGEPIVRMSWPSGKEEVILERGDDLFQPKIWYIGGGFTITEKDLR